MVPELKELQTSVRGEMMVVVYEESIKTRCLRVVCVWPSLCIRVIVRSELHRSSMAGTLLEGVKMYIGCHRMIIIN